MNTPGHLQNFIGAEVHSGQHVASTLDDVAESRVVYHHRVQPANVERALPGSRHREEIGLALFALEKGTNHTDGLATVIVRCVDSRESHLYLRRSVFHARACWQEHPDAALLLDDLLEKSVV